MLKSISVPDERRWVSIPATLWSIFEILFVPLRLGEGGFGRGRAEKVEFIGSLIRGDTINGGFGRSDEPFGTDKLHSRVK